jgi:CRISPR-associated protein Cas5d
MPMAMRWMDGREQVEPIRAGGGADDASQRNMLALADVEYVFTAEIRLTQKADPRTDNIPKYVDQVMSRAAKGKCAHRPALGCREFAANFEIVEKPPAVTNGLTEDLGLMLYDVFDPTSRATDRNVAPKPVFFAASVTNGRMDCHPDRVRLVRAGTGRV